MNKISARGGGSILNPWIWSPYQYGRWIYLPKVRYHTTPDGFFSYLRGGRLGFPAESTLPQWRDDGKLSRPIDSCEGK